MEKMNSTTNTAEPINTASAADVGERDSKGRKRDTPGNPFARQTAKLRQAALDAVSEDDMRDIFMALKEKAKKGDVAASRLLLSYTVGKPGAAADPDMLDQHEFKTIVDKHSQSMDEFDRVIEGTPIELVLLTLRAVLPALAEIKKKHAAECFAEPPQAESAGETMSPKEEIAADDALAAQLAEHDAGTEDIPDWMRSDLSMIPTHEMARRLREMTRAIGKQADGQRNGVGLARTG